MTDTAIANRREREAELYRSGVRPEEIGAELGVSAATVRLDLRAIGVPLHRRGPARGSPKIVFSPADAAERRARVSELAGLGKTDHEIGRLLRVSKTTIRNDRRALGIAPRPPGQPPKSPLPDDRACETCGRKFRPRRENVKEGGGRFCSRACMVQDERRREASRQFVGALNASRAERVAALAAEEDLLTREQAAAELGIGPSTVDHYLRRGYLAAVSAEDLPGQPARLLRRADIEGFRRDWLGGDDRGRRSRWLDPEYVVGRYRASGRLEAEAQAHGLSAEDMVAVYRSRIERRRQRFASRRGRPARASPPEHHLVWASQFEDLRTKRPSDYDAYLAVAEFDFASHPERWAGYWSAPGDPQALHRDWEKPAVDRVRKAVKALQIPATEIP